MCKLRSELSECISSRCLYYLCHCFSPSKCNSVSYIRWMYESYYHPSLICHTSILYARVLSTHFSISYLFAMLSSPPSTNSAPGADGWSYLIVLPNPLPPDVANNVIFLPVKSYFSRNVLMIVGATYHQIGNPSTISS